MNVKYCVCLFVFDENVRYHKKKEERDKCQKPTKKDKYIRNRRLVCFFCSEEKYASCLCIYKKKIVYIEMPFESNESI